ncbi:hypothetical protein KKG52_02680 [Patescibacteria group bacterium]|nr:hypothetical protein [Patescibacteria group bacterium]
MTGASKTRLTFKKIKLALLVRSHTSYRISREIVEKHKLDKKLNSKELQKKYLSKKAIPEISRLSYALNLPYKPLWKAIVLKKFQSLSRRALDKEKIKIYLAIENELIFLSIARNNKSYFKDSDYEEEFALLSMAIERAAGNSLKEIKDDFIFSKQLEVLQRKYTYWYYKTAYRYKLPTIRIVPFILRLIKD